MRRRFPFAPALVALPMLLTACVSSEDPAPADDPAVVPDEAPGDPSDAAPLTDAGATPSDAAPAADAGRPPVDSGSGSADAGASGGWPAAYATLEQQVLEETNKRRALGADCRTKGRFPPAPPVTGHPLLQAAARKHSQDMALKGYFAHNNLAGLTPFDRMKAEGYKGGTMGENIAAGNATAVKTVDQWMNSDGHCANIMNAKYTQLGVGYFYSATSKYKHYWTQNFGAGG